MMSSCNFKFTEYHSKSKLISQVIEVHEMFTYIWQGPFHMSGNVYQPGLNWKHLLHEFAVEIL